MWGCESCEIVCASRSKRWRTSGDDERCGRQDLDRHRAVEPRVARPVDLAHPARAERRDDLVGAQAFPGREGHRRWAILRAAAEVLCPLCQSAARDGRRYY